MLPSQSMQAQDVGRFSGLYSFIASESFANLGIDPADVPLGTYPAEDHPPFLPNQFGGNAYGLGFYEQGVLSRPESELLESLDFGDPEAVAQNHKLVNDLFKRLGLLIRYSSKGKPYYLIPRQYVAHYLVEIQAKTEEISTLLGRLLPKRMREDLKVALLARESELLMPELRGRMPDAEFIEIDSLEGLTNPQDKFDAVVVAADPFDFAASQLKASGRPAPANRQEREALGYFISGLLFDLVAEGGEVLFVCDSPLEPQRNSLKVGFKLLSEYKRFLLFSHLYRTRKHYKSGPDQELVINRYDFNAFLSGLGILHETVDGFLGGASLAAVEPSGIDGLPYQNLPLPRGSSTALMKRWKRWLSPYFELTRLDTILPDMQRRQWQEQFDIEGDFAPTMVVCHGLRRRPAVSQASLESTNEIKLLSGCAPSLLADYKDSFEYVLEVIGILQQVRQSSYEKMPGLELSRLKKPFENKRCPPQLKDVLGLMAQHKRLKHLESRLNPAGVLGQRTPVLANLEKLSLLGLTPESLRQLYLIVVGHSTMTRVTFGKLPEESLTPLTELSRFEDVDQAVELLRVYRLMSVVEAAAAAGERLRNEQVAELFSLYDDAIRVVTSKGLTWQELLADQITRLGGVQAKAIHKMLKLFDLFEFMESWERLVLAGGRQKEALADYDSRKLARIQSVVDLISQLKKFVSRHYPGSSTARPYFFRVLLSCEFHGTGRLFPGLGTAAGVILLWICVHTSRNRLINFNTLIDLDDPMEVERRVDKLCAALLELTPEKLSPTWLNGLLQTMDQKGEAYLYGSGLYLNEDPTNRALTPRFIDPDFQLDRLEKELEQCEGLPLSEAPQSRLRAMDGTANSMGRYLGALARDTHLGRGILAALPGLAERYASLTRRMEEYLLSQLFVLKSFSANLQRLSRHCPNLVSRLLMKDRDEEQASQRSAAAQKLTAIYTRSLEQFQDMFVSHEAAQAEFGPTATGIVGLSYLQFGELTQSLKKIIAQDPRMESLMMMAVLLYQRRVNPAHGELVASQRLERGFKLSGNMRQSLQFLLDNVDTYWRIISGEDCLVSLDDLLVRKDPLLLEALFILAVIHIAVRREGIMSEDLFNRLIELQQMIRKLTQSGSGARKAYRRRIVKHAKDYQAFLKYRDLEPGQLPPASLRYLMDTMELPSKERGSLLERGRQEAGLLRLIRLRELYFISPLDLHMLEYDLPAAFIYNHKGLRSLGRTHFERDLYEGLRTYRGLMRLESEQQEFLLNSLADTELPLRLAGYSQACRRLTYSNQILVLLLGVSAARRLELKPGPVRTVSFWPLAGVIERRFELINQAVSELKSEELLNKPQTLQKLFRRRDGLTLRYKPQNRTISVGIGEPEEFDRELEGMHRAGDAKELKRIYHGELRKLRLTSYSTLDYQQRLEEVFQARMDELGRQMLDRVREDMAGINAISRLLELYDEAWEEGLELPLAPNRQQSLRDLLEMNLERVRADFLQEMVARLEQTDSLPLLEQFWNQIRDILRLNRDYFGKDFDLIVAERFDAKARELDPL